jgi:hypothetical protein
VCCACCAAGPVQDALPAGHAGLCDGALHVSPPLCCACCAARAVLLCKLLLLCHAGLCHGALHVSMLYLLLRCLLLRLLLHLLNLLLGGHHCLPPWPALINPPASAAAAAPASLPLSRSPGTWRRRQR